MTTSRDPDALAALHALYTSAADTRTSGQTAASSEPLYQRYVDFVARYAPTGAVLDVGCGAGWSTYWFAARGFAATGVDLNPAAFEAPPGDRLRFEAGSGLALPFPAGRFDAAAANQCLEHVPDPAGMLDEMIRVVKPGGVVCVVGPNLLGVGPSVAALTRYAWRNRPRSRILFRDAGMPRHPFGNTLPEAACALARNLWLIARKSASRRARFTFRRPDLVPPFHADNDACYLCNPLDLARYFRGRGCTILAADAPGRSAWTRVLAGGTWVAARTPAEPRATDPPASASGSSTS